MSGYRRSNRTRANATITALSLASLLGFGALAVDVAWVRYLDAQLEAATDAASLAGASQLDGTEEGLARAVQRAVEVANLNPIAVPLTFGPEHVELGRWDPDARAFIPLGTSAPELTDMVRVTADLDDIPAVLARAAFGVTTLATRGGSGAYRPFEGIPAARVDCYLPLVLPACMFPEDPSINPPPMEVNMGDDTNDTVGWALPGGVNANALRQQLLNPCDGSPLVVGEEIDVQNGVVNSAVSTMGDVINGQGDRSEPWDTELLGPVPQRKQPVAFPKGQSLVDTDRWGWVVQGPIALVDLGGEPGTCAGAAPFNQDREIRGFTWGVIYDARKGNAQTTGFMLQLDFTNERQYGSGASPDAQGNVTAPSGRMRLVL